MLYYFDINDEDTDSMEDSEALTPGKCGKRDSIIQSELCGGGAIFDIV